MFFKHADVSFAVVQTCECANQAKCDPISGECLCAPGWSGVQCTDSKLLSSCCHTLSHTIAFTDISRLTLVSQRLLIVSKFIMSIAAKCH